MITGTRTGKERETCEFSNLTRMFAFAVLVRPISLIRLARSKAQSRLKHRSSTSRFSRTQSPALRRPAPSFRESLLTSIDSVPRRRHLPKKDNSRHTIWAPYPGSRLRWHDLNCVDSSTQGVAQLRRTFASSSHFVRKPSIFRCRRTHVPS